MENDGITETNTNYCVMIEPLQLHLLNALVTDIQDETRAPINSKIVRIMIYVVVFVKNKVSLL